MTIRRESIVIVLLKHVVKRFLIESVMNLLRDAVFMKEGYWSKRVDVQRAAVQSSELSINLISHEYGINIIYLITGNWFATTLFRCSMK